MMMRDSWIRPVSFLISLCVHLLILLIVLPAPKIATSLPSALEDYRIPVQLVLAQPPMQKAKEEEHPVAEKPQARAKLSKKLPKPERMAGDRDQPGIIQTSQVPPVYPKEALNNDWEGTVVIECDVDDTGKPIRFTIIRSSGHDVLDASLIRTVQEYWKFNPKRVLGKDVIGKVQLSYEFKIQ